MVAWLALDGQRPDISPAGPTDAAGPQGNTALRQAEGQRWFLPHLTVHTVGPILAPQLGEMLGASGLELPTPSVELFISIPNI